MLEKDSNLLRQQLQDSGEGLHVSKGAAAHELLVELTTCLQTQDHLRTQLQSRIDQLETLLRERSVELDRLKRHNVEQPNARIEQELQQRVDNLEKDNRKLLDTIESQRRNVDAEKQQQVRNACDEAQACVSSCSYKLFKKKGDSCARQSSLCVRSSPIVKYSSHRKTRKYRNLTVTPTLRLPSAALTASIAPRAARLAPGT